MSQNEEINHVCDLQIIVHRKNYQYHMYVYSEPKTINVITMIEKSTIFGVDFLAYQSIQGIRTKIWKTALSGFAEPVGRDLIEIPAEKLVPVNAQNPKYSKFKLSGKWNMSGNDLVESYIEFINPARLQHYDLELYKILTSLLRGCGVSFSLKDFTGLGFKELHFF